MTVPYWYDQEFTFTRDAVFIGRLPLPGVVDSESVSITTNPDVPDEYRITLTFVSSASPAIGRGVCLNPDGRLVVLPTTTPPKGKA